MMAMPTTSGDHESEPSDVRQAEAELLKVLAHPLRLWVLDLLTIRDRAVAEILDEVRVAPSSLSTQLAILRRAGMVAPYRYGGAAVYALADQSIKQVLEANRRCLRETALRSISTIAYYD